MRRLIIEWIGGLGLCTAAACGGRADQKGSSAAGAHAGASGEASLAGGSRTLASGGSSSMGGSATGGSAGRGGASDENGFVAVTQAELVDLMSKACSGYATADEVLPQLRLFVLDASWPMAHVAPGFASSDWDLARSAISTALKSSLTSGLSLFPNRTTSPNLAQPLPPSACIDSTQDVELGPTNHGTVEMQRAAIEVALAAAQPLAGAGAPTFDAFRLGVAALRASPSFGSRLLVLVTDGQPTLGFGCMGPDDASSPVDPELLISEVEAARADQVLTFVIGTPGSASTLGGGDARPWLSRAARVGGMARPDCKDDGPNYCHYDLSSESDAEATLPAALAPPRPLPSCEYDLAVPPPNETLDLKKSSVIYTTSTGEQKLITQQSVEPCEVGWHYVKNGAGEPQLEICQRTCAAMSADRGTVEVLFGCVGQP